ncbi:unnamed protein product [Vitrella brassicaformis CCMP3155]|uniref:Pyroglutamyl-peptidase I n=2 Tax=Vitrella brassicaformis TaxID=1169539 RepID=A0A0G4FJR3_VITBC|nr:unnamed protein product [Vitrella brassicaformis CCMP3155]|mmetsp:Transcript_32762/g.81153  ORF Transcript_32762/g.81153 Transcript_32762/m.81153 type:complete len:279 (+) Transcript_32762:115-951(+)|eukprot:CEM13534.1 unnamed protein product [Vitrella brassicaformis CCMP3155]
MGSIDVRPSSSVRDDSSSPPLLVYVTGFGPFNNVPQNPTETLIRELPRHLVKQPLPGVDLCGCEVIEVSAEASNVAVQRIHQTVRERVRQCCGAGGITHAVIVHLGVYASDNTYRLESLAYNEAAFSVPDERKWQPRCATVCEAGEKRLACRLPVHQMNEDLRRQGFKCQVSVDAGRFVCNFLYYRSLFEAATHDTDIPVLFVHVPQFFMFDLQEQLSFLSSLFVVIRQRWCECKCEGGAEAAGVPVLRMDGEDGMAMLGDDDEGEEREGEVGVLQTA